MLFGVAQRELAGQRARRPPDHGDRRTAFRRASDDEQLRGGPKLRRTTRPAPSVTLSLISGPGRRGLRRLRPAPPPSVRELAAHDSRDFLGRIQRQQARPTRRARRRRGRARAPRDRRTRAPSGRRAAPRALPRRGAPPRRVRLARSVRICDSAYASLSSSSGCARQRPEALDTPPGLRRSARAACSSRPAAANLRDRSGCSRDAARAVRARSVSRLARAAYSGIPVADVRSTARSRAARSARRRRRPTSDHRPAALSVAPHRHEQDQRPRPRRTEPRRSRTLRSRRPAPRRAADCAGRQGFARTRSRRAAKNTNGAAHNANVVGVMRGRYSTNSP